MRDDVNRLKARLETAEQLLGEARAEFDDDDGTDTPYLAAEVETWLRHRDRLTKALIELNNGIHARPHPRLVAEQGE